MLQHSKQLIPALKEIAWVRERLEPKEAGIEILVGSAEEHLRYYDVYDLIGEIWESEKEG